MRSRCVLKDFKTTMRDDISSINKLFLHAAWNDLRRLCVVCAFMQADTSSEMCARPLKGQENEGWIWRLHGAMDGKRTTCRDLTEFLAGVPTECRVFTWKTGAKYFCARLERDTGCIWCRRPTHLCKTCDIHCTLVVCLGFEYL